VKEIGEFLREAREEKGLTIEDISRETKIQIKYLFALEEGDFSLFSGEIYIKGALRNYARVVGISDSDIISFYEQFKKKHAVEENGDSDKLKKGQNIFLNQKEKKSSSGAALIWIGLFVFVVCGSIWYLSGQSSENKSRAPRPEGYFFEGTETGEAETGEAETGNAGEEGVPAFQGAERAGELEVAAETKELVLVAEDSSEVIYSLSGVRRKEIALHFSGSCWVRILQDGKTREDRVFNAGESKNIGDAQETWIRLGNPQAARIKVNDLEIDSLVRYTSPVNITIKKE
jgi:cytoskeletal protein RodZ